MKSEQKTTKGLNINDNNSCNQDTNSLASAFS